MTSIAERSIRPGRVPPHSTEAEESVLGAILLSSDAANQVMDKLHPEDFYVPSHQAIFEAILDLYNANQAIDAITVSEALRRSGDLEKVGGVSFITGLINTVPSASNIEYYATIVEEHALRRNLIHAGAVVNDLALQIGADVVEVLDRAEQTVLGVAERRIGQGMLAMGPMLSQALEHIELLEAHGSDVTGLSTGFRDLDRKLAGLQKANLVIVAARPSMGKCLAGSTRIIDPKTGRLTMVEELVRSRGAGGLAQSLSFDSRYGSLVPTAPVAWSDNGIQPTYAVMTASGRRVTATAHHPLLTPSGWRPMSELGCGDPIAVALRQDVQAVDRVSEAELVALVEKFQIRRRIPPQVFGLPLAQLTQLLEDILPSLPMEVDESAGRDLQHLFCRVGQPTALVRSETVWRVEPVGKPAESDLGWDPIISIEPAGAQRVFDLEIPIHHNFVADDVIVHNSALTTNIATNVAQHGNTVAMFSLEMSKEEVVQRILCSVGRVDSMKLRTGQLGPLWTKVVDAASRMYKAPIFIDDSPVITVTDIRAKCRRLKRQHGLSLVLVDYLQLMQGTTRENRQQEIAEISRNLKNLARELEVPILAVSQLNRSLETREDKRPRLADLRESGSLEQDADVVMFIYRHEYYHPDEVEKKGMAEVNIAKHRAGATGTVEMTFLPEFTRFADLGRDMA